MALRRVTVLMSEEEYAQVRRNANHVPLSTWFRNLALGERKPREEANRISDVPRNAAIRADVGRESVPAGPTAKPAIPEARSRSVAARLKAQIPELKTANELPAPRGKVCAHGTAQGYACWQCGGKAQIEQ
jgi:hypothetical protein